MVALMWLDLLEVVLLLSTVIAFLVGAIYLVFLR